MTTSAVEKSKTQSLSRRATYGAIAGLGGGLIFGTLMGVMGMLPMVGMLVRIENAAVGFIVHMIISAFIGAVYGIAAGSFPSSWTAHLVGGVLNGVIWWVLGALLLMPLFLGMDQMIFVIGQAQWMSLIGHILYGLVTAVLFFLQNGRAS